MAVRINVLLNESRRHRGARRLVTATLVKGGVRSCLVRLPDGNVVKRKVRRDLPLGDYNAAIPRI